MRIEVDVKKNFGSFDFSLSYSSSEPLTAILGPSGAGKSVFLKIIAGIIKPDKGYVKVGNRILFDSEYNINIPPQERRVGYLFQNYALFPTMNVYKNITLALKKSSREKKEDASRVSDMLGITHLMNRMPSSLSGGEKQRVALARLLVTDPDIILLDEPFSALDASLRESLRSEMKDLIKKSGKTSILVSHDIDEAYYMSSYTYLIKNGSLIESGANEELYFRPKKREAAELFGIKNIASVFDGFIRDWNIKSDIKTPYAGLSVNAFSLDGGDSFIRCRMLKKEEGRKEDLFVLETESGAKLYASFLRGAEFKGTLYFNKESIIALF